MHKKFTKCTEKCELTVKRDLKMACDFTEICDFTEQCNFTIKCDSEYSYIVYFQNIYLNVIFSASKIKNPLFNMFTNKNYERLNTPSVD